MGFVFLKNFSILYVIKVWKGVIKMLKTTDKSNQIQVVCIEDLIPKNHLLRKIEKAIDWSFIYDLVEDKYCLDNSKQRLKKM